MKAIVTGGLGFIGPYVISELHARGYEVHVLDNFFVSSSERVQDLPAGTPIHNVDIRDVEAMSKVVNQVKPQAVVHLAAIHYIPYCNANPLECYDVNVRGTSVLLDVLRQYPVERVFIASSAGVYQPSDTPHQEDQAGWPVDIYGFTKRSNEFAISEWSKRTGIPVAIGRYFNVFGYGETSPHITPILVEQIRQGTRQIMVGNLSSRRDYIHVTDIARLTCDLIGVVADGAITVNIGTGVSYSVQDIIDTLSTLLQHPLEISQDPRRMRKQDRPNLVADLTKLRSLGLTPPQVSLQDGLGELLERGVGPYLSPRLTDFLGDR
jgi:UDP-glucose 4-epimerase